MFDKYTIGHMAFGSVLGLAGVKPLPTIAVATAWELFEQPMKKYVPKLFPDPSFDSPRNIVGDVLGTLAGYAITNILKNR